MSLSSHISSTTLLCSSFPSPLVEIFTLQCCCCFLFYQQHWISPILGFFFYVFSPSLWTTRCRWRRRWRRRLWRWWGPSPRRAAASPGEQLNRSAVGEENVNLKWRRVLGEITKKIEEKVMNSRTPRYPTGLGRPTSVTNSAWNGTCHWTTKLKCHIFLF